MRTWAQGNKDNLAKAQRRRDAEGELLSRQEKPAAANQPNPVGRCLIAVGFIQKISPQGRKDAKGER